ncbi:MAG: hypothetical protein KBC81_00580 [Candidatus Pacebacteria bacterium]|nr:hypothetical protein [Candidatus Paceibacterota bacterium]
MTPLEEMLEERRVIHARIVSGGFPITLYPWVSKAVFVAECKKFGAIIEDRATELLARSGVGLVTEKSMDKYVIVSARDIGLRGSNRRSAIYRRAREVGLQECHPQAGWELLIPDGGYNRSPFTDVLIASEPIEEIGDDGVAKPHSHTLLFEIRGGNTMSLDSGRPEIVFREERQWLFRVDSSSWAKN